MPPAPQHTFSHGHRTLNTKKDTAATTVIAQRARAFDEIFDAVVVTDLEGIVTDWNVGAQTLYGWSYDEIVGQPVSVLHVPSDVEGVTRDVLDAIVREGKCYAPIYQRGISVVCPGLA